MTAETHPDPFQDALSHGLQRAVQVASCVDRPAPRCTCT